MRMTKDPVKNVDEYIASIPEKFQEALIKLRKTIQSAAPKAEECISYQIPAYKQDGMLVGFGATAKHCSLYVMSPAMMKELAADLKDYETSTGTIKFTPDEPLPVSLVKKIVKARLAENASLKQTKKTAKTLSKKKVKAKADADDVDAFMADSDNPFKKEVEAVRKIIKGVDKNISERIKWKAPSYYYNDQDMVTFNLWETKQVHLVFHHPQIVKIKSPLLEGDYPTRRMTYFKNMKEVKENKKELERIMKELLKRIGK